MAKRDWDDMKISGFGRLLYRLYLGITYPLRHPVVTVVVLLAFFRHELEAVWMDYKYDMPKPVQQVAEIKEQTTATLENKLAEMTASLKKIISVFPEKKEIKERKTPVKEERFISWNIGNFNKAKYTPKVKQTLSEMKNSTFAEEKQQAKTQREQQVELEKFRAEVEQGGINIADYYVVNDALNLEYVEEPEILQGKVRVIGPNQLYVNDEFLFLYGIYTDPRVYDEAAAQEFLENLTAEREIYCEVVAYTKGTQQATALCFADGQLINKLMTTENLARNVALK